MRVSSKLGSEGKRRLARLRGATANPVSRLGFSAEIHQLREAIAGWLEDSSREMASFLAWQFGEGSKYFRPLTVFSCYRAMNDGPVPERTIASATVVEMLHNVSLIIDDILDKSEKRRGKPTLHFYFGLLPALMTSGYIVADAFESVATEPFEVRLFSELMRRLSVAECLQWRLRRQPLGVEDWLKIAGEDTGSMFEICACLGTRNEKLRRFGHLLGVLYHGCDDVGDAKSLEALGGGGDEDLRDGILTLPAAFAIRDPRISRLFCTEHHSAEDFAELKQATSSRVANAEDFLDKIADDAREEARLCAGDPRLLLDLIDHVRSLSQH